MSAELKVKVKARLVILPYKLVCACVCGRAGVHTHSGSSESRVTRWPLSAISFAFVPQVRQISRRGDQIKKAASPAAQLWSHRDGEAEFRCDDRPADPPRGVNVRERSGSHWRII